MADYASNSHKSKEADEKKELSSVVRGNVTVKKEPISRKFADTFLADNLQNVRSYVFNDVIVPAITDAIVDALTSGIGMLFKGNPTAGRNRNKPAGNRVNYSSYSRDESRSSNRRTQPRDRHGYADIIFDTRGDAQEVMDCLDEVLDKYKVISIADFYDLAGVPEESNYTDRNYGWYDLNGMVITRDRDGYRIKLPKPEVLD